MKYSFYEPNSFGVDADEQGSPSNDREGDGKETVVPHDPPHGREEDASLDATAFVTRCNGSFVENTSAEEHETSLNKDVGEWLDEEGNECFETIGNLTDDVLDNMDEICQPLSVSKCNSCECELKDDGPAETANIIKEKRHQFQFYQPSEEPKGHLSLSVEDLEDCADIIKEESREEEKEQEREPPSPSKTRHQFYQPAEEPREEDKEQEPPSKPSEEPKAPLSLSEAVDDICAARPARLAHFKSVNLGTMEILAVLKNYHTCKRTEVTLLEKHSLGRTLSSALEKN